MTGNDERIAIVGLAGLLPGAEDLNGFWANVRSAADCSSNPPPGRWPITPEELLDPRLATPDRVPTLRGYYLQPYTPDLTDMELVDWPIAELDPVFHLALHVGNAAWRTAIAGPIDRRRCGVILGNIALPTEKANAITLEVFGPKLGLFHPKTHTNRLNLRSTGLPAALIARGLGFGLGGYALDAACASSLYAIKLACDELKAGRADAMIAGGIHRSDSMYTQMGFAQLRALSPSGRCSPFDARADGLVVGEGGCAFVLKRLSDALTHGDTIHGVIAGIGLSNDIEGNVLQPAREGQLRALRAAYLQAGWRPSDVQLIECHATGTPTGDAIEFESLRQLWKGESGKAILSGVKSTVGHLLTGAGAAALAKVLLAIRHKTLPPTANFSQPSPKLNYETGPFRLLTQAKPWESNGPRRAAINGFGFGGINAHLLVEEWIGEPRALATCETTPVAHAPGSPEPVAVVGIASQSGSPIEAIELPVGRFRIPPTELSEMLPQQTLMLKVAAEALDDCQSKPRDRLKTGVYIGVTLDPNTTNYHLRWLAGEIDESIKDQVHPALTANRTMGSLASIAASRVARFLGAGGPSFAVCDEKTGGFRSLALAVEALRNGEIDRALVGGVEFATDARLGGSLDSAAAVILKRQADAERDGDHIYEVVDEARRLDDGESRPNEPALGALALVTACKRINSPYAHGGGGHPGPTVNLPVGYHPKNVAAKREEVVANFVVELSPSLARRTNELNPIVVLTETQSETMRAHETYLRFATTVQGHFARTVAWQTQFVGQASSLPNTGQAGSLPHGSVPKWLEFEQCMEFARGLVGNVLGPKYAEIDSFPTRVRLPDGPLQLVDRIPMIEGEPLSMTPGRVVTEHLVHDQRWYLEHGRIPACIAIEAGQADLFLGCYLGIDFKTRGLARYRLLDATVTFHRELPKIGEQIVYDIRIVEFFRQGDTHLFRFQFEGTVDGHPLLTMKGGCAGFFTTEELAAGRGIVHTALDLKSIAGKKPDDWSPYVPLWVESLSDTQVDTLRKGNLVAAFGPEFARARLTNPSRLPGGMLKLVHRVERIEPTGGRYGLGRIRCEADIHPDDWFLTCHFVDDQVMPGTLMYECCLHTLRVLLMRMGWVCEEGEARFEPVPGVASKLKCRGQVIAATQIVTYEVSLKEIGFRPEPFVIADALMYADSKPIVEVTNISLRMSGMTRERLNAIWQTRGPLFTHEQVLEFAIGSPSKAFGDRYQPFDHDRFIARLPGPPFSFLDRVNRADNCEQWKLIPGAIVEAEYDVPSDAWYFGANRCDSMPYSVLNEIALQACGWTAAYLGAALTSPEDLAFRNLGGNATQFAAVRPDTGTLTTSVKLTKVAPAAGMIIVAFDFDVRRGAERIYAGDTTFGFFSRSALANQVGLTGTKLLVPSPDEVVSHSGPVPSDAPFPDDMLRMVDTISWLSPTGGSKSLGAIEGRATVDPDAWFFKAHFFQDPVWPGSLGLESFVQLMKVFAHQRWGSPANGWQAMVPSQPHRWAYRGQIVPTAKEVTVQSYVTDIDDSRRFLRADGLLAVDGRIIYQMTDFTLQG